MSWSAAGDKFKNPWSKKKNRIPAISVSALDCLTQGFNFVVSMNEFTYGFKEVSNIEVENPCDSIQEGGVNDHKLIVGKPDDSEKTLTFKRGLILRAPTLISNAAKAAAARIPNNIGRRAALIAVNALDPQESLESGPSLGIIQVYSRTNELTGLYKFISVGLKSWKLDDLSATDDSILIEEITVYHTGLLRMPVTLKPALFVPSSYSDSRDAWDADAAAKRWEEARKTNAEKRKENEKNLKKDAKARREESEKKKLNAETQKMLDEAKRILGDDFDEFAGDLNSLLDGEGSIEDKLKTLDEEKAKLTREVKGYYDKLSSDIKSREEERRDKYSKDNIESTMEKLKEGQPKDINDKDYVSDKQQEKRNEIDEKNRKRKEDAERRAEEARERERKRMEELEKIRAEQAENRAKVEEAKNKARQERLNSRNEMQTKEAEEEVAKESAEAGRGGDNESQI